MAITVQYQPPADLLAQVALSTGAATYRDVQNQRDREDMREMARILAQRNAQREQIGAQERMAQFERGVGLERLGAQERFQQQQQGEEEQFRFKFLGEQQKGAVELQKLEGLERRKAEEVQFENNKNLMDHRLNAEGQYLENQFKKRVGILDDYFLKGHLTREQYQEGYRQIDAQRTGIDWSKYRPPQTNQQRAEAAVTTVHGINLLETQPGHYKQLMPQGQGPRNDEDRQAYIDAQKAEAEFYDQATGKRVTVPGSVDNKGNFKPNILPKSAGAGAGAGAKGFSNAERAKLAAGLMTDVTHPRTPQEAAAEIKAMEQALFGEPEAPIPTVTAEDVNADTPADQKPRQVILPSGERWIINDPAWSAPTD